MKGLTTRIRSLNEVSRLNLASSLAGSVGLAVLALVPNAFGPGRAWWVFGLVPVYAIFAGRVLLCWDRKIDAAVLCWYACVHTTLLGLVAQNAALRDLFLLSILLTPLTAAMTQPARVLHVLLACSGAGVAVIVLTETAPLGMRIFVATCGMLLLSAPGMTVLHYRVRLDAALAQAEMMASTDVLTGLANRRGLADRAPALVAATGARGGVVAVLAADLDHFKQVNDRFGHAVGDQVLRQAAFAISSAVREGDLVARIGGEELCVIATLKGLSDVEALAERVRAAVERETARWGMTVSVGAVGSSAEVLLSHQQGVAEMVWDMLDLADGLLYEAKSAGRNAVRVRAA